VVDANGATRSRGQSARSLKNSRAAYLRDVDGRTYEEIAGILQTSEGTVKSPHQRAQDFAREMKAYLRNTMNKTDCRNVRRN